MKPILTAAILLAAMNAGAAVQAPLWLRDSKISPDGKSIAFTYKGDIYTVPTAGGVATRLTTRQSREATPVWSPDSKSIAFQSNCNGNFDIFLISASAPGEWKRLTFNSANETPEAFTPDGKNLLYSASIQDPASSATFPSGRLTELYSVPVDGGASVQVLATPARSVAWAPDGKSFLYEDVKGFEDTFRKHHTSGVTRDIWRYTPATGRHSKVVARPGEDLSPVDAGEYIYFISERAPQKSLNVYKAPASDPAAAKAITSFKTHPVRFLSRADNGTLAFAYDGEIYTMTGDKSAPKKVNITINADYPEEKQKLSTWGGAREAAISPDGSQVAIVYRGDVFVTAADYNTTKQISDTPEAEQHVTWANDSTLYYVSERDGKYNIYRATFTKSADEPDFAHAVIINEEPVFKADGHERTYPSVSPDGKQLGFILDRTRLAVMDLKSKKVRELTDGSTHVYRNGGFEFFWSPDSRWIACEVNDNKRFGYNDIAIINVADGKITNITGSGYDDVSPRWIMDGNALAFVSERKGMRNHASWGTMTDVYFVFMNQDAYDRFRMSKEDRELFDKKKDEIKKAENEAKKKAEEKDKKDKKDGKDDKKDGKKKDEPKPITVEIEGISDRQVRVTPLSTEIIDEIVSGDGKTLYFLSRSDDGAMAWKIDLEEGGMSMVRKGAPAGMFITDAKGKKIYLVSNSSISEFPKGKNISFHAVKNLDPAAEREFMFDNAVREVGERFYVADMHGVDWPAMAAHYRKFLPHINNNYDFANLMSEILGELNVSHTGGRYSGTDGAERYESTGALGALYDMKYSGKGARIDEIIAGSPLARVRPLVKPGTIIEKINGEEITAEMPLDNLLHEQSGVRTQLTLRDPDGNVRNVVVRPVSKGVFGNLLYKRWVDRRRAYVDSISGGRLAYVHIESMDDASFRKVYSDLMGKDYGKEGAVIDVRWNGGGRLHEDVEVLFSGKKYFEQEIRGTEIGDMPSRRWVKPSIMVMCEACYSNAHGTPWVYKNRGIGKLVGMPVPGTMTSVNWVHMQDPSLIFGIPVVGYRLPDGSFLENQELQPDIRVENNPETIVLGEDEQLKAAVAELLKEIDANRKK